MRTLLHPALALALASCASDKIADTAPICYFDGDGDGYGDPARALEGCDAASADNGLDCDDGDASISPAAQDACGDGLDADCGGGGDDCELPVDCLGDRYTVAVAVGGDPAAQYTSIQAAIDASADGDRVCVLPGTYAELLDFGGKDVEVVGVAGWGQTVLDGTGLDGSVVVFQSGEGAGAVLQGFTVTGGVGQTFPGLTEGRAGGGVAIYDASPTLRGLYIVGNTAEVGGGVLISRALDDSAAARPSPTLEQLVIRGNDASGGNAGGGLGVYQAGYSLRNALIVENHALRGGGAFHYAAEGATWEAVVVANNLAEVYGGGLYGSGLVVTHALICGNEAGSVGDGIIDDGLAELSFTSTVFLQLEELGYWSDTPTVTYSRTIGIAGEGNITDEPAYDCAGVEGDLSAWWAADDPFAELGDPAGEPDPDGSTAGIGAFFGPYGDDWDLDGDGVGGGPWAATPDEDELDSIAP